MMVHLSLWLLTILHGLSYLILAIVGIIIKLTYKAKYGAMYNWYAVDTRKLCPKSWHVPTDSDWHNLSLYLDPNYALTTTLESPIIGKKLKEAGFDNWNNAT